MLLKEIYSNTYFTVAIVLFMAHLMSHDLGEGESELHFHLYSTYNYIILTLFQKPGKEDKMN